MLLWLVERRQVAVAADAARNCTRCGELKPADAFYYVSRATGKRRGQCKPCVLELKAAQKNPAWRPICAQCGNPRERAGMGRRLCQVCFDAVYEGERRANGAHRLKLNDCPQCGAQRLRADHQLGTALCPVCRSIPQGRRKRLREYNLTPREYLALLDAQGGKCAICRRKVDHTLHIDHKHGDERYVRGAICNPCNTLLGVAGESTERLRAAIAYLELPPAQRIFPGRMAHEAADRKGMSWNRLTRVAGE